MSSHTYGAVPVSLEVTQPVHAKPSFIAVGFMVMLGDARRLGNQTALFTRGRRRYCSTHRRRGPRHLLPDALAARVVVGRHTASSGRHRRRVFHGPHGHQPLLRSLLDEARLARGVDVCPRAHLPRSFIIYASLEPLLAICVADHPGPRLGDVRSDAGVLCRIGAARPADGLARARDCATVRTVRKSNYRLLDGVAVRSAPDSLIDLHTGTRASRSQVSWVPAWRTSARTCGTRRRTGPGPL